MFQVSAHFLGAITERCAALDINRAQLVSVLPDGPMTFADGLKRYPSHLIVDIYAKAKALSGYADLPLRVGQQLNVSSINEAGKILPLCDTMGDVALMLSRYHRLTQTYGRTRFDVSGDLAVLSWEPYYTDIDLYADCVLGSFAAYVTAGRWLSIGASPAPMCLEIQSDMKVDTTQFSKAFGCEIRFGMPQTRLLMTHDFLAHKLASANPEMFDVMAKRLDRILLQIDVGGKTSERAAASIRSRLADGAPSLEQTAADLAVSVRRLRTDLTASGTTFRKIVDTVRQDACVRLQSRGLKKSEIAFRLGFHDQPAFNRARKRWEEASSAAV